MPNQTNNVSDLFERYINNTCTPEEVELLLQYFDAHKDEALLKQLIGIHFTTDIIPQKETEAALEEALMGIRRKIHSKASARIFNFGHPVIRYFAAALVILAIGTIAWLWVSKGQNTQQQIAKTNHTQSDIAPGGNKAVLKLANGSTIVLDSAANGSLANQGNIQIIKLANGQLAFKVLDGGGQVSGSDWRPEQSHTGPSTAPEKFNIITTPKGGQYQVLLADGTKVWLNAASQLVFPTTFGNEERLVHLIGEAYFEVAQNSKIPFKVKQGTIEVQVLGTSFNVNAYPGEEEIKTTLLEGSVRVVNNQSNTLLKPGQRASIVQLTRNLPDAGIKVETADTEEAIAWKNGMFVFNNADITSVMRQISRWYDVDVKFEGNMPKDKFIGEVSRNSNVSEVLKILELSNINFKITGKTITVIP